MFRQLKEKRRSQPFFIKSALSLGDLDRNQAEGEIEGVFQFAADGVQLLLVGLSHPLVQNLVGNLMVQIFIHLKNHYSAISLQLDELKVFESLLQSVL